MKDLKTRVWGAGKLLVLIGALLATYIVFAAGAMRLAKELGPGSPRVFNLSPSGDLAEAAANLFSYLRAADRLRPSAIAVAPIPDEGLGEAINDRLRRAAARGVAVHVLVDWIGTGHAAVMGLKEELEAAGVNASARLKIAEGCPLINAIDSVDNRRSTTHRATCAPLAVGGFKVLTTSLAEVCGSSRDNTAECKKERVHHSSRYVYP